MSTASSAIPVPAPPAWLTWGLRLIALGLGALHTLIAVRSQSMNEDGIQYLDLGDAWWQGQWEAAINTTWSPLYAWILGAVVNLTQPSIWWEFPTVQVVNFVLYAITLACFEYFWRQLTRRCYGAPEDPDLADRMPPAIWMLVGYTLFIYVSLNLVQLWAVTPDMCVSALVYLAAGRLLVLDAQHARLADAVLFGVVLGLAYLAKAAMFPLGLVAIVLAALMVSGRPGGRWRVGLALVAFLAVSLPWVAVVSNSVGHPTFSDVGRFTYLKHVNQMPWPQWQVAEAGIDGAPLHPPRQVHDDPPLWEFATPIGGTYPLAYDPAWWTRGLEPRVEASTQLAIIAGNLVYYFDLFVRMQGGVLAITLVLLVMSRRSWRDWLRLDAPAALILWALAAFGLYALVFVEARYIAPFVLLFWAGLLARVRRSQVDSTPRLMAVGGGLLALFAWINIGTLNLAGLAGMVGFAPQTHAPATGAARGRSLSDGHNARHPEIAEALLATELAAGDRVAYLGYSYSAYWARLARLRIVAEVRPEDLNPVAAPFGSVPVEMLETLRGLDVVAVIAEPGNVSDPDAGWRWVGGTGYAILRIRQR